MSPLASATVKAFWGSDSVTPESLSRALFAEDLEAENEARLEWLFNTVHDADRPYAVDAELMALIALARQVREGR